MSFASESNQVIFCSNPALTQSCGKPVYKRAKFKFDSFRAIREKACAALADYKKSKADYSHASKKKKLATRLEQIQTW